MIETKRNSNLRHCLTSLLPYGGRFCGLSFQGLEFLLAVLPNSGLRGYKKSPQISYGCLCFPGCAMAKREQCPMLFPGSPCETTGGRNPKSCSSSMGPYMRSHNPIYAPMDALSGSYMQSLYSIYAPTDALCSFSMAFHSKARSHFTAISP